MRLAFIAVGAALLSLSPQGDGIIRLKPADFRQLPAAVRRDLDRRDCRIPQVPDKTAPHNVISGSFVSRGSRDWAVLCSVDGASRILVYRGGGVKRVDSIARRADLDYMQGGANGVMEFSRRIFIAEAKAIGEEAKARGGPKPPPLDHDGVSDAFQDKGSTILYYSRGKWIELPGSN
jgi:hypothetical protein